MIKDLQKSDEYAYVYNTGDCYGYDYSDKDEIIKELNPDKYSELMKEFDSIINKDDSVIEFTRITYKKAWIDNPLEDNKIK